MANVKSSKTDVQFALGLIRQWIGSAPAKNFDRDSDLKQAADIFEAVLAEQPRAAEQPQPRLCGCIEDGKPCAKKAGLNMACWVCEQETGLRQTPIEPPTQQPAGDVAAETARSLRDKINMLRMSLALVDAELPCDFEPDLEAGARVSAYVKAREGMVSFDAVVKMLQEAMFSSAANYLKFRLSHKQPERTVVVDCDAVDQWYVALDGTPLNVKFTNKRDAERYAAGLREELKPGKQ